MFIRSGDLDKYISNAKNILSHLEDNEKLSVIEKAYSLIKDIHSVDYNKNCVEFSVRIIVGRIKSLRELLSLHSNNQLQYAVFDTMSLVEIPVQSLASIDEEFVFLEIDKTYKEILESKYSKRLFAYTDCKTKKKKVTTDFNFDDYIYEQMSFQF